MPVFIIFSSFININIIIIEKKDLIYNNNKKKVLN
jgi:hypothetical protein